MPPIFSYYKIWCDPSLEPILPPAVCISHLLFSSQVTTSGFSTSLSLLLSCFIHQFVVSLTSSPYALKDAKIRLVFRLVFLVLRLPTQVKMTPLAGSPASVDLGTSQLPKSQEPICNNKFLNSHILETMNTGFLHTHMHALLVLFFWRNLIWSSSP